jgi:branched-chain amino acid transport system substrate-binding protein
MSRRRVSIAVLALVATLGLTVTGGAATAASHRAGANTIVKIGVLAPLDAGLTEFGKGIRNSVQVAVDQANARKAIPGWTIQLEAVNDSSDPAVGAAGAATLVADPAVIGVVGTYNSGVALQALPVLSPAHLALVSPANTLPDLTLGTDPANPARPFDSYFRMVASDARQAPFLAKSARKLGVKTVAIVSETKAVSKGLADAFSDSFTKLGGRVTVQKVVPDGATAPDFNEFLSSAIEPKLDMIFFGGEYQVAATLRKAATAKGFKKPIMGGDGIKDPAYISGAGKLSKGDLASTVGVPAAKLKTAAKFFAAYAKAKFDTGPTDYGPYAYDAANLIIAAAKRELAGKSGIPSDARQQLVAALQGVHAKGVTGPLGFDAFGDTKNRIFTLYRVQKTKHGLDWVPFKP